MSMIRTGFWSFSALFLDGANLKLRTLLRFSRMLVSVSAAVRISSSMVMIAVMIEWFWQWQGASLMTSVVDAEPCVYVCSKSF